MRIDCLVQDRHGGWLLRYTAHKTGGATKELPVETPVVESTRRWEQVRAEHGIRSSYLFPSGRRRLHPSQELPPAAARVTARCLRRIDEERHDPAPEPIDVRATAARSDSSLACV